MTTKAAILIIAPELSDRSDDVFDFIVNSVALEVTNSNYGSRVEEARTYLAAHLLTLVGSSESAGASGASGPVTSEKMGSAAKDYASISDLIGTSAATRYDLTSYGSRFISISRSLIPRFLVV